MQKLGATITWSILKILRFKFQQDEYAFVEGSSDLCYDKFGLYRNCSTKLGGTNSKHSLG